MPTGKVARWVASRGFGFIVGDNGGPDVFCHLSALPHGLDRLAVGTRVNFDIVKDREGRPRAAKLPAGRQHRELGRPDSIRRGGMIETRRQRAEREAVLSRVSESGFSRHAVGQVPVTNLTMDQLIYG